MNTSRSLLCVYHDPWAADWNTAANDCLWVYGGAHLCRHEEIRRACINGGGFVPITEAWLADRIADDRAVVTNIADCNNFDGDDTPFNVKPSKYCCSEWPKY